MEQKIEVIKELIEETKVLEYNSNNYDDLNTLLKKINIVVRKIFGTNTEYLSEIDKVSFSPFLFDSSERDFVEAFENGKKNIIINLNYMIADLSMNLEIDRKLSRRGIVSDNLAHEIYKSMNKEENNTNNKIFIVHGHNVAMKQEVARTLEKLNLEPIILHEQPDGGKTIIEKFTDNSNVGFAIVLLSADDIAYPKDSPNENKKRARQNVILELGYFLGKLGREKVLSLYEENSDLEIPTDYMGVLFTPYDNYGSWKTKLARELRHAGYKIDAEAIVNL